MTDVKIYKLLNGAEIIARLRNATDTHVTLEEIRMLHPVQVSQGTIQFELHPYIFCSASGSAIFPARDLVEIIDVPEETCREYLSKTSGIIL